MKESSEKEHMPPSTTWAGRAFPSDHRPTIQPVTKGRDLKGEIDHTEYVIGSLLLYMTFAELRERAYDILYEYHRRGEARRGNATNADGYEALSRAHSIFSAEDTRDPQTWCFNFLVQIQAIAPRQRTLARPLAYTDVSDFVRRHVHR